MKEIIVRRLLSVKSIVTLILTAVFAWLAIRGTVGQEVYTVVIAFYFGTQSQKAKDTNT